MRVQQRSPRQTCLLLAALSVAVLATAVDASRVQAAERARIELKSDAAPGQLQILIDGREALVYR